MTDGITDQELVVHLFVPAVGPRAAAAHAALRALWQRCRTLLRMDEPIGATGLAVDLPQDLSSLGQGPAAAVEDRLVAYQALVRRHQDVLVLSLVLGAPLPTEESTRRIGSATPAGWVEFSRWWREIRADLAGKATAEVRVFQGKYDGVTQTALARIAAAAEASLPSGREHPGPVHGAVLRDGMAVWEPEAGAGAERDLVVVADPDRDREMSAWTWSTGDPAIPPLARYLAHASDMRYQVRVFRAEQESLHRLRTAADELVRRSRNDLTALGVADELQAAEAKLVHTASRVKDMSRAVAVAGENMRVAIGGTLPHDTGRAEWLVRQLADVVAGLEDSAELVRRIRALSPAPAPAPLHDPATARAHRVPAGRVTRAQNTVRMGFVVDIVGYSGRKPARRKSLQDRLAVVVDDVLGELGLVLADTDHQGTGDGLVAFLPPDLDVRRALHVLLSGTWARLNTDNLDYQDHMRLRLAIDIGPVGLAAFGFGNGVPTRLGRLVDCAPLRAAVAGDGPGTADVAAMVSDVLHGFVVGEGHTEPDPAAFTRHRVKTRGYSGPAWLWSGGR
ncbi:CATRA conflict system CASPASE/TPR repeat-associated protein [Saccharothrix sp. NRRL B-16348]|uniref:CATRA conflict system CASPASE/TPR repeat-associated protein n=1 Tax=Saccharothrix sp. NRRL B-16348 TaxID=1415542 RepID=UPI0006AF4C9D|nr:CATRA conflict system CASPASE/TPR repeat-associated protein [Saccharothrix sp. NRRL B-16348]